MEVQCLRVVFREPTAYYVVNRKLRELANEDRRLIDGPLAEWCADDFTHAETRALMLAFVAALMQDELDPLDYLRLQADIALQPQLDVILADDLSTMRERVRDAGPADLQRIYTHNRRAIEGGNAHNEVVEKVLELRAKRLKREREELAFLQMDAQASGDEESMLRYGNMIFLSNQAQQLLDANLQKFKNSLRE